MEEWEAEVERQAVRGEVGGWGVVDLGEHVVCWQHQGGVFIEDRLMLWGYGGYGLEELILLVLHLQLKGLDLALVLLGFLGYFSHCIEMGLVMLLLLTSSIFLSRDFHHF